MKAEIRYQSISGNTEAVALAMGKVLGIPAKSVEEPIANDVGLVFLGGGIYASGLGGRLKHFVSHLTAGNPATVVCFSTSMNKGDISFRVKPLLEKKGITLHPTELNISETLIKPYKPDVSKQVYDMITNFVADIKV
ncbi:hypothetical protein LJC56_08865 [Christensenellaceae bacterium OttesenSCG-928-K19]|nr:hypothetical protein [Christensenellaceae bacterium OttesenSCG-928-K19]